MSLAIDGYAEDAAALVPHWLALDPVEVLAPVLHLLPQPPARVLDVGAGAGRDAMWLAGQGHDVTAVEPVRALREAAVAADAGRAVEWLEDRLPDLSTLRAQQRVFDVVLLTAVWAHLGPEERRCAMPNLAVQVAPGGRLVMSVRHGWTPANRPVFPADPDETVRLAEQEGLRLLLNVFSPSVQALNRANGVGWTWLAFERP